MEKVNEMTEGDVSVGAGTLYALLPRFENIGYIQLLKEENKRKIYINIKKRHIAASPAGFCNMPL